MAIHDYTIRTWGHDYTVLEVKSGGASIRLSGWGNGLRDGDFILLQNGDGSTRYLLRDVKYLYDPRDMWFAVGEFAPRSRED